MSDISDWPLVIDLDNALLKTNSLDETFMDVLRGDPVALLKLPLKLAVGRHAVKAFLAAKSPLDVNSWPVHSDFLEYVETHVKAGRKVVLATAANKLVADAVAARFPFIGEVIASDGARNMKGAEKARRLRERFPKGFIYAGDSAADLGVWKDAAASIFVNARPGVVRRARTLREPMAVFPHLSVTPTFLRRGLRLHQWAKNLLIFIPLVLGGKAGDARVWLDVLLGFLALGCAASASYIVNDLCDLPSDRRHRSKRTRPLASGDLSIRQGMLLALAGLGLAFAFAAHTGIDAVAVLMLYVALTLSYSLYWKRVPVLDVFVLACLFTLRLGFGIVLANVRLSPWLLVFSMFVFLSLSLAKRHTEIARLGEKDFVWGRGYAAADAPFTLGMGLASMLGAVLIVVLYLIEDAFPRPFYANPEFLWAIPAIMFLLLSRVWLLAQRGQLYDDPVAFALKDRVCLSLGLLMGIAVVAAIGRLGVT